MLAALPIPAAAHTAPPGWAYDTACCSTADCHMVPSETVSGTGRGFSVAVPAGSHPSLPEGGPGASAFLPHGNNRIRQSGDSDYHACIRKGGRGLVCLYVPSAGS